LPFALLHAGGLQAVDENPLFPLEPEQSRARLTETLVGVGEFPHAGELFRGRSKIPRPSLAAVGEDRAGMPFPVGTVAVGLSAAAAEGIERTGKERLAAEEGFGEFLELLLDGAHLQAERTEVVGHGLVSGARGRLSVCYNTKTPTDIKPERKKVWRKGKKQEWGNPESEALLLGAAALRKATKASGPADQAFSRPAPSARV
jgi:hypothetical protein